MKLVKIKKIKNDLWLPRTDLTKVELKPPQLIEVTFMFSLNSYASEWHDFNLQARLTELQNC